MIQSSINLDVKRVVGYREFCNKLWNIVKFGLGNFPADFVPSTNGIQECKENLSLADKWILSRLSDLVDSTNQNFTEYKFGDMVNGLYDFWRKELADVYLEAIKPVMKSENQANKNAALNTLYLCLDQALKLLHPTMPYITEELYQRLPHPAALRSESICISKFPANLNLSFEGVKENMDKTLLTVKAIRSQLAALNVASNAKPTIFLQTENQELRAIFQQEKTVIQSLVKAGETSVIQPGEDEPAGCLKGFVCDGISIYVKVIGLIDIKLEVGRINKRVKQLEDLKLKLNQKIGAPGYETKVPENVRQENLDKLAGYDNELAETQKQLGILEKFL